MPKGATLLGQQKEARPYGLGRTGSVQSEKSPVARDCFAAGDWSNGPLTGANGIRGYSGSHRGNGLSSHVRRSHDAAPRCEYWHQNFPRIVGGVLLVAVGLLPAHYS